MDKINGAGHVGREFVAEDAGTSRPPTEITAEWLNAVQRELVAVVEGAGLTLSSIDSTQVRQAIIKMIQAGQRAVIIDAATFAGAVVGIGKVVYWDSANNRFDLALADGSAKQSAVGFADVPNAKVYCFGSTVLFAGLVSGARYYLDTAIAGAITSAMPASNAVFVGIAKGATEMFVDIDAGGLTQAQADARYCGVGIMLVEHQLAQGTDAGNTSAGVNTRPLNTVIANTIPGASLSSNQITLPAGTYRLRAVAEAFHCNISKIALYNVTDAVYVAQGMSINGESIASDIMGWAIPMVARFSIAAPKVFEIRQYSEVASTGGFGRAANSMGVEVYASVEINRE